MKRLTKHATQVKTAWEARKLKPNEYRCSMCHNVFEKGWTDEEARAEEAANFGRSEPNAAIVCDDCYKKFMSGFIGNTEPARAVHLLVKKIGKRSIEYVTVCGFAKRKMQTTRNPEETNCPNCRKQYLKWQNEALLKRVKGISRLANKGLTDAGK